MRRRRSQAEIAWQAEVKREVIARLKSGCTLKDAAALNHVELPVACQWALEAGLPCRPLGGREHECTITRFAAEFRVSRAPRLLDMRKDIVKWIAQANSNKQLEPEWEPGTKLVMGSEQVTLISVHDHLSGRVMTDSGEIIDPFVWKKGPLKARSLGPTLYDKYGWQIEYLDSVRVRQAPFMTVAGALRDLGNGFLLREAASRHNVSIASLSGWASKKGVKVGWKHHYRGPLPTDSERAIIRRSLEVGPTETARNFHLTRQRIHQILAKYREAGWREAPGWAPGEVVDSAGHALTVLAVYDADVGAVLTKDRKAIDPFEWNRKGIKTRSRWIVDKTTRQRLSWKQ